MDTSMLKFTFLAAAAGICLSQVILSPENVQVLEGENVLLTCSGEENKVIYRSEWFSSNGKIFRIYYNPDSSCRDVKGLENGTMYSVYCNEGNTSILLRNVTRSRHNEEWFCRQDYYMSNFATVYVLVPVTSVQIQPMNIISTKENSSVQLSCSTSFARPAPNITWYLTEEISDREDHISLLGEKQLINTSSSNEGLFSTKSDIFLFVNRSIDSRFIYCAATNHAGITHSSVKLLFEVKYPPSRPPEILNFTNGSTYHIVENQQGILTCTVEGGKPPPSITWECYNGHTETIKYDTYVTSRVTWTASRELKRTCTCASEHVLTGKDIVTVNVDVIYVAKVISFFIKGYEGKDIITVQENDTVRFTCLIDTVASNAKLMFHWRTMLVEESDTSNLTYILRQVSCKDSGEYMCVGRNAFNYGQPSVGHLTLFVKCPPHIYPNTPIQESSLAKPGDRITFSLDIIAYPEPYVSDFVWMKSTNANWTKVNNSSHTEISTKGLQTNLTIESVTEDDYGKYRLTVVNELGAYSQILTLEKVKSEENTNVVAIVVGIVVGGVVLVGIISVAIFLTRNANHKREFPCISMLMKLKGGKRTSTIWKTSSSAAVESNESPSSSGPQNIYEQLQRNREVGKEYQDIQLGADDKCVYKNIQLHPPPATS